MNNKTMNKNTNNKSENTNSNKNYLYAGLTIFMWGTMAPVVKVLVNNMSDMQTLAVSSVFAFIFLVAVNCITGNIKHMKEYTAKDYLTMAGLGFLGLFMYSALYYYGISVLSSQEACILNYLWPIMLVIFSCIILKEKMTTRKLLAMIVSFMGIVVISSGNNISSGKNAIAGIVCCVLAAMCYGLFSVLNKKKGYNQNISMMIIWFTTAICSFAVCFVRQYWVPIESTQWGGILWLGLGPDALAYLLWALALEGTHNTAKIANLAYLTPFISVMLSTLVFREPLTINAVIALALIISGIIIQNVHIKKR